MLPGASLSSPQADSLLRLGLFPQGFGKALRDRAEIPSPLKHDAQGVSSSLRLGETQGLNKSQASLGLPFDPIQGDYLIDPITAKEHRIELVPVDKLLEYNLIDKAWHHLKSIPHAFHTVWKGLRGDSDFGFSNFMDISKVPYYLGGLCLTLSFMAAGGERLTALKQGLGVLFYYLGVSSANTAVDWIYKLRYGIDLSMLYRRADGRIEKIFASGDFPRFDLLRAEDYRKIRSKMRIPNIIADPDGACREQIFPIIHSSRAIKLVLGNLLAAIGAGYLARSDAWGKLLGDMKPIVQIWKEGHWGGFLGKLSATGSVVGGLIEPALREKLSRLSGEGTSLYKRLGVLGVSVAVVYLFYEMLNVKQPKRYQSSPTPIIPWHGGSPRKDSIYTYFHQIRLNQEAARGLR